MHPIRVYNKDAEIVNNSELITPVILNEINFRRALEIEKKRSERSQRRFVLMLVDCAALVSPKNRPPFLAELTRALSSSTRETDTTGWYEQDSVAGTIFTELGLADGHLVSKALLNKATAALAAVLSIEQLRHVKLSFHVFPDDWSTDAAGDSVLHPDANDENKPQRTALKFKRALDFGGSLFGLLVFLPLFAAIAMLVKSTSKGPVFFRQQRVGRCGRRFTFLKFRSMYVGSRHEIHEKFVKDLIRGSLNSGGPVKPVFKIVNDPRVTPIGRFLRRTSLDELPQLINVLRGEMSLVGPRPPVPYEVESYKTWHRRRLIAVKPGITGLWQVRGRSRVAFEDMIRLDLEYARNWSIRLDLKILLQTPRAVLGGEGAY